MGDEQVYFLNICSKYSKKEPVCVLVSKEDLKTLFLDTEVECLCDNREKWYEIEDISDFTWSNRTYRIFIN